MLETRMLEGRLLEGMREGMMEDVIMDVIADVTVGKMSRVRENIHTYGPSSSSLTARCVPAVDFCRRSARVRPSTEVGLGDRGVRLVPPLEDPPGDSDVGEDRDPRREPGVEPALDPPPPLESPLDSPPLEPLLDPPPPPLDPPRDSFRGPTLDSLRDPPREEDGEGDRDENIEGDRDRTEALDALWVRPYWTSPPSPRVHTGETKKKEGRLDRLEGGILTVHTSKDLLG